jgi:hypothetical protein
MAECLAYGVPWTVRGRQMDVHTCGRMDAHSSRLCLRWTPTWTLCGRHGWTARGQHMGWAISQSDREIDGNVVIEKRSGVESGVFLELYQKIPPTRRSRALHHGSQPCTGADTMFPGSDPSSRWSVSPQNHVCLSPHTHSLSETVAFKSSSAAIGSPGPLGLL